MPRRRSFGIIHWPLVAAFQRSCAIGNTSRYLFSDSFLELEEINCLMKSVNFTGGRIGPPTSLSQKRHLCKGNKDEEVDFSAVLRLFATLDPGYIFLFTNRQTFVKRW